MIKNSGFLSEENELTLISTSFSEMEILGRSASNIYGHANRFGKRWFFKGVAPDCADVAAARQRLLKEFDIQIGLVHHGIERVVSFENIEGIGLCIIAEWIEGESLEEVLTSSSFTRADRLRILSEITDAIGYLHSQGIVHRDLKPANIMIRKNGETAVVIDFGLADTDAHLYQKLPAGTEGYASQRQYIAHTPYTGDDIHALGVIMEQLCPELSSIAKGCRSGKYTTAEALRQAILRRRHRRRFISWAAAGAGFLIAVATLLSFIASLRSNTENLQSDIHIMTDSLVALRTSSQATNSMLRDSLTNVNSRLEYEKDLRLMREHRQAQFDKVQERFILRLEKEYTRFRKTADASNRSAVLQLAHLLEDAKGDFFANCIPFTPDESEVAILEHIYVTKYQKIIVEWMQICDQIKQSNSQESSPQ